jgi:beta-lactamase regulating signal transducer with metallopeptidase domain
MPVIPAITVWRAWAGDPATALPPFEGLAPAVPWIAWLWLAGLSMSSARLVAGWWRVRLLLEASTPASDRWQQMVEAISNRLGVRRRVRLVESDRAEVPGTVGWLAPVILFPIGALTGLTPDQVKLVLTHELAHIRRHDYAVNCLQTAIETVFFFHPAVWWLSTRVREEREHCCDDIVVGVFEDRWSYAEALTSVERLRRPAPVSLVVAASSGALLPRVKRLLDNPTARAGRRGIWVVSAVSLLAAMGALMVALSATTAGSSPTVSHPLWIPASLGLVVGMRHAIEPDHLAAISTLVAGERSAFGGARLGLSWGLGHTLTLLVVGGVLAAARVTMPEAASAGLEGIVGVMLLVLGGRAIRAAWVAGTTGPENLHAHGGIVHRHTTSGDHVHVGGLTLARRPLLVGLVHGLAGSGTLAALVMTTMPTVDQQIVFMCLFGLGSTLGMAALSGLVGLPLARLSRSPLAFAWTSACVGIVSVCAGCIWSGAVIWRWL